MPDDEVAEAIKTAAFLGQSTRDQLKSVLGRHLRNKNGGRLPSHFELDQAIDRAEQIGKILVDQSGQIRASD